MKVIYLQHDENVEISPSIATIGFFDGVHLGHQFLIRQLIAQAQKNNLASMVITFDQHPRQVLQSDYQPQMLSTLDEKVEKLKQTGVDYIVIVHFDRALAQLSAYDFMQNVLERQLNVAQLVMGYDNRFGHNRAETFDDYVRYGKEIGICVSQNTALEVGEVNVSSSVVRRYIAAGEMEKATQCLGMPYSLTGKVVSGFQNGRKLGFPTANIDFHGLGKLLPALGVYAVKVYINTDETAYNGMLNIGIRPTFDGKDISMEVNIFNFSDNLYGQNLTIHFISYLRSEEKFDTLDALKAKMEEDKQRSIKILSAIK